MKIKKHYILLIFALIFVGFYAGRISAVKADSDSGNLYSFMKLFTEVITKLQQTYVDSLDAEEQISGAIKGMLKTLDPYTTFLTQEDFLELKTATKGEFGGLGIHISSQDDYITVISVIEGTPASRAGLMPGDKIIKVKGESTKDWSATKAASQMRGPKGTSVDITIQREGLENDMEFNIVRDVVKIESVPYVYKIKDDIGYIRITTFNATTGKGLHNALVKLQKEGIKGLLIDVRSNPGGLLSQAIETVDQFLPENKLVVSTKGRVSRFDRKYYTKDKYSFNEIPIIVLINQASASASEIFAGSLQDWDKALVVGKNSFGKGSVQQLFPLTMNYGIKITTSKYYIESGRCIHKDKDENSEKDIKKDEKEDKEIFNTVSGRVVYGGGGITPDIEIKQDTLNSFAIAVRKKNLIFNFAVEYIASNDINKNFTVTDEIFNDFVNYIYENKIEYTDKQMKESERWLRNFLETQIISNVFGLQAGNKIAVRQDAQLQKALELFEEFSTLDEMFTYSEEVSKLK